MSAITLQTAAITAGSPTAAATYHPATGEQLLVAQTLAGDKAAFSALVATYEKPVYNLCFRMLGDAGDAEDAAQESFLRAYLQLESYDPERPFKTWLMAIASHYCIDRLRRRRMKCLSLDDEPVVQGLGLRCADRLPDEAALDGEQAARLQRAISRLPAATRSVVTLRYWGDLSCEEIAAATGASVNAVKSRLHRARVMLAELLSQDERCAAAHVAAQAKQGESPAVRFVAPRAWAAA